jgi:YebC/PmpR family DNA-binding regulatory protein
MAGHSKWANIQHRKARVDAKRGKIFTRINRELTVAAREGGGDPDTNPRLRLAIDKANAANMPKDNIERAIKKATGDLEGVSYEEIIYEGYAQGGVAVLVECMTDNRNRTVAEVRHAFTKHGGNLGTDGSVAYLFDKMGVLNFAPGTSEDEVMEVALEAGADDVVMADDGSIEVITDPASHAAVVEAMEEAGLHPENAEITKRASTEVSLDVETGQKVLKFLDVLEDLDDTQEVYSNADIPDEAYAE